MNLYPLCSVAHVQPRGINNSTTHYIRCKNKADERIIAFPPDAITKPHIASSALEFPNPDTVTHRLSSWSLGYTLRQNVCSPITIMSVEWISASCLIWTLYVSPGSHMGSVSPEHLSYLVFGSTAFSIACLLHLVVSINLLGAFNIPAWLSPCVQSDGSYRQNVEEKV